jgi:hypothetical protein
VAGEAFVLFLSEGFFELHKVFIGFLKAGFVHFEIFVFASSLCSFAVLQLRVFLFIIVIVLSFALFLKALAALFLLFTGVRGVFGVALVLVVVVVLVVGVVGVGTVVAGRTFGADVFLLYHLDDHAQHLFLAFVLYADLFDELDHLEEGVLSNGWNYSILGVAYQQEAESFLIEILLVLGGLLGLFRNNINKAVDNLFNFGTGIFDLHKLFIEPGDFGEVGLGRG